MTRQVTDAVSGASMNEIVRSAISGLLEAIGTPPDRNDLGHLAQMHSWGQQLIEASTPDGGQVVCPAVGDMAQAMVLLLERLILDEAADPATGIQLVPETVHALEALVGGQTLDVTALKQRVSAAVGDSPGDAGPCAPAPPAPAPVAAQQPAPVEPPPPPIAVAAEEAPPAAPDLEAYVSEPLVIDLNEREHLDGFLEEAAEHMDAIEAGLLEVEADPSDTGKINELFRPFHTIKGIAGFLNLRDINRLTHEIETILDMGRKSELKITATIVDLLFAGVDVLKAQLAAIRQYMADPQGESCPQPVITAIMAKLRVATKPDAQPTPQTPPRPKLGEVLVAGGTVEPQEVAEALQEQMVIGPGGRKMGEILVERGAVTPGQVEQALVQQATGKPATDNSIRVDTRKLDFLVDAVGELVIAQSMVSLEANQTEREKLLRNVSQVTKIVRDVQETAMAMRMVPIGNTFQKMRRLVRDVSRKAGKNVELVISGEETELDKNVIQQISDPLVHMVRNAVDHGIETPAQRAAAGKSEQGKVWLNAYHQGDSIVVEIKDDGRGLDREKLVAKGIERGLISPDDNLSDQQVYSLILHAGFSTAEKVTDISGRGVGMDVVRRNVEQLRGKIEIQSQLGAGSTFQIRLPLTLAIIDGMLVRVAGERMIIPTILIEQSLRPERKQVTTVQCRGAMLQVRGELCPLIQLGTLFGYGPPINPCEHLVVIVQCEGQKVALVVEELIGQQQVVIKTLGQRFKRVHGVSGAAILGDGRVGMILEPTGILALHKQRGCEAFALEPARVTTAQRVAQEEVPQFDFESTSAADAELGGAPGPDASNSATDVAQHGSEVHCLEEPVTAPV